MVNRVSSAAHVAVARTHLQKPLESPWNRMSDYHRGQGRELEEVRY